MLTVHQCAVAEEVFTWMPPTFHSLEPLNSMLSEAIKLTGPPRNVAFTGSVYQPRGQVALSSAANFPLTQLHHHNHSPCSTTQHKSHLKP